MYVVETTLNFASFFIFALDSTLSYPHLPSTTRLWSINYPLSCLSLQLLKHTHSSPNLKAAAISSLSKSHYLNKHSKDSISISNFINSSQKSIPIGTRLSQDSNWSFGVLGIASTDNTFWSRSKLACGLHELYFK